MAKDYYNLSENATFRDMVLSIRADESIHREFNHYFCDLGPNDEIEGLEVFVMNDAKTRGSFKVENGETDS